MADQPATSSPAPGAEVALPALSNDDYASITDFNSAMALVGEKLGGVVVDASDLGDGFAVLDNKDKRTLIGAPLIVLSVSFHDGDHGEFASCRVVTQDGRKLVVNDGGSGIYDQIKTLHSRVPSTIGKPIMVRKGLRESRYDHPIYGASVTYYLDTSA